MGVTLLSVRWEGRASCVVRSACADRITGCDAGIPAFNINLRKEGFL